MLGGLRAGVVVSALTLVALISLTGCEAVSEGPRYSFTPDQFRKAVQTRLPQMAPEQIQVPFEIDPAAIDLAHRTIQAAPRGHARVEALVRMLHEPPPAGLGLRYAATTSRGARETLALGKGNCVSLASVLVGLGRGLGWPIYYAEALVRDEEIHRDQNLAVRADHMVVVITARTVTATIDFTGPVEGYGIRIIDDLQAYAHLLNNQVSERILHGMDTQAGPDWEQALQGFSRATRLAPDLARAWNNQGVALARLGRLDEARGAYAHALEMDAGFDSPQQNLIVLETRARGAVGISTTPSRP